jgi:hypothetical protein
MAYTTKDTLAGFRQNGTTVGTIAVLLMAVRKTLVKVIEIVPCHLVYVRFILRAFSKTRMF